jgi:hypothetical protein
MSSVVLLRSMIHSFASVTLSIFCLLAGFLAQAFFAGLAFCKKTRTKVTFKPDPSIMTATEFNYDTLAQRLGELAFSRSASARPRKPSRRRRAGQKATGNVNLHLRDAA